MIRETAGLPRTMPGATVLIWMVSALEFLRRWDTWSASCSRIPNVGTLLITGGDTLLQCMNYMGVDQVEPVCELSSGVVLSLVTYQGHTRCVLTKSGGFGQETLVTDLARLLAGPEEMCKPQAVNA